MKTTISLLSSIFLLDIGLAKYNLKVDLEYSPDTISEATIVDKKGIWLIKIAIIILNFLKCFPDFKICLR